MNRTNKNKVYFTNDLEKTKNTCFLVSGEIEIWVMLKIIKLEQN